MKLEFLGHNYQYACEQMLAHLFPDEKPVYEGKEETNRARLTLSQGEHWLTGTTLLYWNGRRFRAASRVPTYALPEDPQELEAIHQREVVLSFFRASCQALGRAPVWGAITGVRPAKMVEKMFLKGATEQQVRLQLRDLYQVEQRRIALAMACAQQSMKLEQTLSPDEVSLYIGVPFCPTRCSYCSFVSADIGNSLGMVEPFLLSLEKEMAAAGRNLERSGRRIRTIYIGGGTPTTLNAAQLEDMLTSMEVHLDLSSCVEFTVEAGRPDTITPEKLAVLARHGVQRVSVNPQSMQDAVLEAIGRPHRARDIVQAYKQVRAAGEFVVNMDLIAGLPRDTPHGFSRTLDWVLALAPENITVHTLARKRGSAMAQGACGDLPTDEEVEEMLNDTWERLQAAGYVPYYLYRQKHMSGGLENVGWCLPGTENQYNILMMEELHSVLALGGGGITKLVDRQSGAIRRKNNPKYPKEYIERIELICKEKESLSWHIV